MESYGVQYQYKAYAIYDKNIIQTSQNLPEQSLTLYTKLYPITISTPMQNPAQVAPLAQPQPAPQPPHQQPQRNRQILFIISIYLLFTLFSHLTTDSIPFNKNIINIIANIDDKEPLPKTMFSIFATENYVGYWAEPDEGMRRILSNGEGKARIRFQKFEAVDNVEYQFLFYFNDGEYIDGGNLVLKTIVKSNEFVATRSGTSVTIKLKQTVQNETNQPNAYYQHQKILKTIQQKIIKLSAFTLVLSVNPLDNTLDAKLNLQSQQNFSTTLTILKQQSIIASTITFAAILFLISYMQFSAVMEMLRAIFEGRESAESYSIVTILGATMWDAVVCVVAFVEAFGNEESLILFIMPAFLLCLLFTNLELRVLLMVFQARSDGRSIRQIVCKFNLVTYGGLLLMYPLMKLTNLSPPFFLLISLLLLPQIYHNAQRGQRPNPSTPYYSKFLTFRFLLILYLKCFPWNVYDLQPNYLLSFSCVALLCFQIFLLWVQKQYGPKKVVPKFLLPPVFNYSCDPELNIEQGSELECAICLSSLNHEPQPGAVNNLNVPFRVMRGPCGHKFHGSCLAQWMQIKMECPQCRGKLPPFQ